MDTAFWQLIEDAWLCFEKSNEVRKTIVNSGVTSALLVELNKVLGNMIMPRITEVLQSLSKLDLLAFDQTLERKLYDIDREEVHEYIEGSDDGFLYARGFVVALGKDFYNQINTKPYLATQDQFSWYDLNLGCPEICFIAQRLFQEKYNETIPETDISRESYSNEAGWE